MEDTKLISKKGMIVDLVITILFFIFMSRVCMNHVPAQTFGMKLLFGVFTAIPLATVAWMALGLFRVTRKDMKQRRAEGKDY